MSDDPAELAVRERLRQEHGWSVTSELCRSTARAAVEAARPIIEAPLRNEIRRLYGNAPIHPLPGAADNGEPELDDQVSITGHYPPTGDTVWPPADNGEPE